MMNHEKPIAGKIDARGGLLIIFAALGIFTFFLFLTGYGASLFYWLPFLLLLACPLMHLLMHRRHAHGAERRGKNSS